MKIGWLTAGALATAFWTVALGAARPALAATDPLAFDDAGMHFKAPEGWSRLPAPAPEGSPDPAGPKTLLAAFGYVAGKNDSRVISIVSEGFDGSLDGAESSHETDLRNGADTTLVDRKTRTTLANGMPAWFLRVSQGSDPFTSIRLYEYVVVDGTREIVVSYSGRQLLFSEEDAKKALASLYVVVYPRRRP